MTMPTASSPATPAAPVTTGATPQFLVELRQRFPQAAWPWVLAALRRDSLVWDSLAHTGLGRRALDQLPAEPEAWSPAALALLMLDDAPPLAQLRTEPFQALDERLSGKASQALEDWARESRPPLALGRCGLLALALRERLAARPQDAGAPPNWTALLAGMPSLDAARTILACLYGMAPDPLGLLAGLLSLDGGRAQPEVALHVLFSNPLPEDGQAVILSALCKELSDSQALALLKALAGVRPALAASLASEFRAARQPGWQLPGPDDGLQPDAIRLARLAGAVQLAAVNHLAAEPAQAVPLLVETLRSIRQLRGRLSAQLAQAVESAQAAGAAAAPAEGWQGAARETSLEAWKQAIQFDPDDPQHVLGLAFNLDRAGRTAEARQLLQKGRWSERFVSPRQPLVIGRLSLKLGDHELARSSALKALELADAESAGETGGQPVSGAPAVNPAPAGGAGGLAGQSLAAADLSDTGAASSSGRVAASPVLTAAEYLALVDLCQQEGLLEEVLWACRLGLRRDPLNDELLARQALAQNALDRKPWALESARLALALRDAAGADGAPVAPPGLAATNDLMRPGEPVSRLELQRVLVEGLEAAGYWEDAVGERQKLVEMLPTPSVQDWRVLAATAVCAAQSAVVIDACRQVLAFDPDDLQAHERLGQAAMEAGELDLAAVHYSQAVRLAPDQPRLWKALVQVQRQAGQEESAFNSLTAAAQALPGQAEIHLALGQAYASRGALTEALSSLRQAASLAPGDPVQLRHDPALASLPLQLGQILFRLGRLEEARQALEPICSPACPDVDLAQVYGQTLLGLGSYDQAAAVLAEVVRLRPEAVDPALDLSNALLRLPDQPAGAQRALPFLQRLLGAGPEGEENGYASPLDSRPEQRAAARVYLAEAYSAAGDLQRSMDAYRQALDEPFNRGQDIQARLALGMGLVALKMEQPEMAVAALQEAATVEPLNLSIQRSLADAYLASGLPEDAFQAARTVRDLAPGDPQVLDWFIQLGAQVAGQPNLAHLPVRDEMIRALRAATALSPERGDWLLRLGRLLASGTDASERAAALEIFEKLVRLDGGRYPLAQPDLLEMARLARELDNLALAAALLQRALRAAGAEKAPAAQAAAQPQTAQASTGGPARFDLIQELVDIYQQAGKPEEAVKTLDQELASSKPAAGRLDGEIQMAALYERKGELLWQMARPEAALNSLERALNLAPKNARLRSLIARILRYLGRLPAALLHVEQGLEALDGDQVQPLRRELHLMAAELAYATLRPRRALEHLKDGLPQDDPAYDEFNYASLRADLALEVNDLEFAAQAVNRLEKAAPDHPRTLAASSRLACRGGDCERGGRLCGSALQGLVKLMESMPGEAPKTKPEFITDMLAVSQAAIENRQWEQALHYLRLLVEMVPEEAISHLRLGQALVLRAESQSLCQDLEVVKHAPGADALGSDPFQECERCFGQAGRGAGLGSASGGQLERWDDECRQTLALWVGRGRAVFQPSQPVARGLQTVLEKTRPEPANLAALVMAFRRCGQPDQAVRAIQVGWQPLFEGQDPRLHPLVQVQRSLAEPEPRLALDAAQMAVEQSAVMWSGWPELAMLQYLLGRSAQRAGQNSLAAQSLQQALASWPDEPRWHALAAGIYQAQDLAAGLPDLARALLHLEKSAALEPQRAESHLALGLAYLDNGLAERAVPVLDQAVRLDPAQAVGWLALAKAHHAIGNLASAAESADRAIDLQGETQEAMLLRAELALKTNNPRGALSRLQAVLSVQPDDPQAQYMAYQALSALERHAEALAVLEKVLPRVDDPLPMQIERVRLVRNLQGMDAGLKALQQLVTDYPGQPELEALLADWLAQAGQQDAAVQAARLALQDGADLLPLQQQAELHLMIGLHMRRIGQLDQAIVHLNQVVGETASGDLPVAAGPAYSPASGSFAPRPGAANQTYLEAYLELGRAYQDRREYKQALKVYQRAINLTRDDYRPYYLAGMVLKDNKDYVAAEAMLRRAAQLAPDELSVHRLLGAVVAMNLVHNHRPPHDTTFAG